MTNTLICYTCRMELYNYPLEGVDLVACMQAGISFPGVQQHFRSLERPIVFQINGVPL